MGDSVDTRISRLLDQLGRPDLSDAQIKKIRDKIKFLQELEE